MNNALNLMRSRLNIRGGVAQQDRMIKDKRENLKDTILYSYQGARIKKIDSDELIPALINPNTVKQDYDDKIVSVDFDYELKCGDVFEWVNTNSHWLIYLQDLTELAYFRGDIRRCRYEIAWLDPITGSRKSTYAAVRGPKEASLSSVEKENFSLDLPNHSLNLLLPYNEDTLEYFKRYSKFYLNDTPICWRVEATDTISTPGIIEIAAVEYYANEQEDDIEKGLVGALIPVEKDPNPNFELIIGETFIKPRLTYSYEYIGNEEGKWIVESNLPIKYTIDNKIITLTWEKSYSGQFVIKYGNSEKTLVVESLF